MLGTLKIFSIFRMEALVKMMGTMVDSVTQVVEGEEVKENRRNLQLEQQQDIKYASTETL